jgi:uncharacterized protein YcaQ
MVIRRDRFERVYAATDAVIPPGSLPESSDAEADDFMLRKMVAAEGLARFTGLSGVLYRPSTVVEVKQWRDSRVGDGTLIEVAVDGWKGPRWALGADQGIIETIAAGRVPSKWRVRETTTDEEATFLSPLDPVSARGRASQLFDFDYKWEVYTPAAERRFGYYTLPVLWGDGLVARFDSRLDRSSDTLVIKGLWLEESGLGSDPAFAAAMGRGMRRFVEFLGAKRVDAVAVREPMLRAALADAASR